MREISADQFRRDDLAGGLVPVVLIVDVSGSMDEQGKLRIAHDCLKEVLDELSSEPWSDEVRVGFVIMAAEASTAVSFTTLSNLEVPPLVAGGQTRLGPAIETTASMLSELDPSASTHRPLVLLLSDGGWEDGWRPAMERFDAGPGSASVRVGVAIGADADRTSMAGFSDEVVTLDTLPPIASYLSCSAVERPTANPDRVEVKAESSVSLPPSVGY